MEIITKPQAEPEEDKSLRPDLDLDEQSDLYPRPPREIEELRMAANHPETFTEAQRLRLAKLEAAEAEALTAEELAEYRWLNHQADTREGLTAAQRQRRQGLQDRLDKSAEY